MYFLFQLSYLAVLHLVVQMHFVWKVVTFLCVSVTLVSKATDTAVQVGIDLCHGHFQFSLTVVL